MSQPANEIAYQLHQIVHFEGGGSAVCRALGEEGIGQQYRPMNNEFLIENKYM